VNEAIIAYSPYFPTKGHVRADAAAISNRHQMCPARSVDVQTNSVSLRNAEDLPLERGIKIC
jgi:hypothetical protein